MNVNSEHDFVVIGAGSAGCVVANRVSADAGATVLLLEAGPSDSSPRIQMPSAFTYALGHARYDWGFEAEPAPQLDGRVIHHPRGRVQGGSSSINAMGFRRGHPRDEVFRSKMGVPAQHLHVLGPRDCDNFLVA